MPIFQFTADHLLQKGDVVHMCALDEFDITKPFAVEPILPVYIENGHVTVYIDNPLPEGTKITLTQKE